MHIFRLLSYDSSTFVVCERSVITLKNEPPDVNGRNFYWRICGFGGHGDGSLRSLWAYSLKHSGETIQKSQLRYLMREEVGKSLGILKTNPGAPCTRTEMHTRGSDAVRQVPRSVLAYHQKMISNTIRCNLSHAFIYRMTLGKAPTSIEIQIETILTDSKVSLSIWHDRWVERNFQISPIHSTSSIPRGYDKVLDFHSDS